MFIREVKKKVKDGDKEYEYIVHRLVESFRTPRGPRQRVILDLGTLTIERNKFKSLANMIEAIITKNAQKKLFDDDPEIVGLAKHYAEIIIRRKMQEHTEELFDKEQYNQKKENFETVDVNSSTSSGGRTVGAEHIALSQLKELGFFDILDSCNFSSKQKKYAAAQICARLVHPASERETSRWLRETSGLDELLDTDFSKISDFTLHNISDLLLSKKDVLEKRLSETTRDLFSLDDSIILYDLTNTFFESPKRTSDIARYGKSKEKRTDAPLVTLALIVDDKGFPKRSKVFEGNVGEAKTLFKILEELEVENNETKTIIIDAGIATEDNLKQLREDKRFEYVAISRKRKLPDIFSSSDPFEIEIGKNKKLEVKSARHEDEVFLLCQSPDRLAKDEAIFSRKKQKFEGGLSSIHAGLTKPRTTKKYSSILERIGRLKERYKIGQFYKIEVDSANDLVTDIHWEFNDDKRKEPGKYLIRTSRTDLIDQKISQLHRTLTMIESAFRWLKMDLGIRPNFHQKDIRMEGHIFISVVAYFVLAPILSKLDWSGRSTGYGASRESKKNWNIPYGWHSIVETMKTQTRVTTSFKCKDDKRMDIRTTLEPTSSQFQIYQRLQMNSRPLKRVIHKEK